MSTSDQKMTLHCADCRNSKFNPWRGEEGGIEVVSFQAVDGNQWESHIPLENMSQCLKISWCTHRKGARSHYTLDFPSIDLDHVMC